MKRQLFHGFGGKVTVFVVGLLLECIAEFLNLHEENNH